MNVISIIHNSKTSFLFHYFQIFNILDSFSIGHIYRLKHDEHCMVLFLVK